MKTVSTYNVAAICLVSVGVFCIAASLWYWKGWAESIGLRTIPSGGMLFSSTPNFVGLVVGVPLGILAVFSGWWVFRHADALLQNDQEFAAKVRTKLDAVMRKTQKTKRH